MRKGVLWVAFASIFKLSTAQVSYSKVSTPIKWSKGKFDTLHIPFGALSISNDATPGEIKVSAEDSLLYLWNGGQWSNRLIKFDTTSTGISTWLNVKKKADSLGGLINLKQDILGFVPVPNTRAIVINGNRQVLNNDVTYNVDVNKNLQQITDVDSTTGHQIRIRSLINGTGIANTGSIAAGYISATGTIKADSIAAIAAGYVDSGNIKVTAPGSFAFGHVQGAGSYLQSGNQGGFTIGKVNNASLPTMPGKIENLGFGSFAGGVSNSSVLSIPNTSYGAFLYGFASYSLGYQGNIQSTGIGSLATGATFGGNIKSLNYGSFAGGYSAASTLIQASGTGSFSYGIAGNNYNSDSITATGNGAFSFGYAGNTTRGLKSVAITATNSGSFSQGYVSNSGSNIRSTGQGSFAQGIAATAGSVLASGTGSFAHGRTQRKGAVQAISDGSISFGFATDSSSDGTAISFVRSSSFGSLASGYASGLGSIQSSGLGSTALGSVTGGIIAASGTGSFAVGATNAITDSVYVTGIGSQALGSRVVNTGSYSTLIGQGIRNDQSTIFKVGYGKPFFIVDGNNQTTSVAVPFILYKVTTVERDEILPTEGMEIYNLDLHAKQYYNGSGWQTEASL